MSKARVAIVAVIVLAIVALFAASQPSFSDFFGAATGRLTGGSEFTGAVEYSIGISGMMDIEAEAKDSSVLIKADNISARLGSSTLTAEGEAAVEGFEGKITVKEGRIVLNGSAAVLTSSTVRIGGRQRFETEASFSEYSASNASFDELELDGLKSLEVNGADISVNGRSVVISKSTAAISYSSGETKIEGKTRKLRVPEAGIVVGISG